MSFFRIHFSSYFFTGSLAIILSWLLSGCRFGNSTELPAAPIDITYYRTEVKKLEVCALLKEEDDAICGDLYGEDAKALIPASLTRIIGDVVGLFHMVSYKSFSLFNPKFEGETKPALPVEIDLATGKMSFDGTAEPEVLWRDKNCQVQMRLVENGTLDRNSPEEVDEYSTLGRVELGVQYYFYYNDKCERTFAQIAQCYEDPATCGGANDEENLIWQKNVIQLFGHYVKAGIIELKDLPKVDVFAYGVYYE